MKFDLDDALIDDILFHMENRYGSFRLDTHERMIVDIDNFEDQYGEEPDFDNDDRFIHLPDWSSDDGYRVMQKFANSLNNPMLRRQLSDALNRSKGVFRAFKDVLEQYPETEKQWFAFKEKKMKAEIIDWYNGLREEWGLEPIGEEPEDTSSLVLEDFVIRQEPCPDCELCFIAETTDGEMVGCICAKKNTDGLYINKLEVKEIYRGMGLGKTLLAKLIEKTDDQAITIDLPADVDFFSRSLLLEGFEPASQRFIRK